MPKNTRLKVDLGPIQLDTRFVSTSLEAQTIRYINCGEVEPRWAIAHSLKNSFGPLAAAIEGASAKQVDDLILSAKRACEALYQQARDQVREEVNTEVSESTETISEETQAMDEDEDLNKYFGD